MTNYRKDFVTQQENKCLIFFCGNHYLSRIYVKYDIYFKGSTNLIKSDCKDIYDVTKDLYFK